MQKKLFIPILLGTNRKGRQSEHVAKWMLSEMGKRDDIETKLFDVREFNLPEDDYGQSLKDTFAEYRDAIVRSDGLIIVSPEYNHGYPGRLKSVLDILLAEYAHKAVGIVGVSAGPWGGVRVIESLIHVTRELGLMASPVDLNFPVVQNTFNEDGTMKEDMVEAYKGRLDGFLDEIVWIGGLLKWGRENVPSSYRK